MVGDRQESDHDRRLIEDSIRRGLAAYERGDFGVAAQALGEVLPRVEVEMPELWDRLGSAYFETRDFERAIDVLERVVSAGKATAQTFARLGLAALELTHFDEAVRYLEAAVDRRPDDAILWRDLGVARGRAGMAREAVTCLREALRLDPADGAGSWKELGRVLRELGDHTQAIVAYREALRRKPENSDLWSDLAILYSKTEQFAESDQALREAIRLRPNNAAAWHTIAGNTLKKGERQTARRAYQRMKELSPDFADEILSWVSDTAEVPPDTLARPARPAPKSRRGRLLRFRSRPRA